MYTSKIKTIRKIGEVETYDLHTPKYHNFFLDSGIVSHNSGKSYCALSMAKQLDKRFTMDNVVFTPEELMNLVESDKLKKGSVIVWDEAGVGISHRSWQSQTNKLINYLLQTFRHRNFILIFTSPHLDFIDASTRKLFHAQFQTKEIDYGKKEVLV